MFEPTLLADGTISFDILPGEEDLVDAFVNDMLAVWTPWRGS